VAILTAWWALLDVMHASQYAGFGFVPVRFATVYTLGGLLLVLIVKRHLHQAFTDFFQFGL
jgi:hypothetical protein